MEGFHANRIKDSVPQFEHVYALATPDYFLEKLCKEAQDFIFLS
jgi:hypothetical protein